MGKGISITPIRKQVNKVLLHKRSRGNIHGALLSGNHKPIDVKPRKEELKRMALAAKGLPSKGVLLNTVA